MKRNIKDLERLANISSEKYRINEANFEDLPDGYQQASDAALNAQRKAIGILNKVDSSAGTKLSKLLSKFIKDVQNIEKGIKL